MSRLWNSDDELYIYQENLRIKRDSIEVLINKINMNTKVNLNIPNIMDLYEDKINKYIDYLGDNNINYFSPKVSKNKIYSYLDQYLNIYEMELIKINNKLINPKYELIINSKLLLFIISKNIEKYKMILEEFKNINLIKLYEVIC